VSTDDDLEQRREHARQFGHQMAAGLGFSYATDPPEPPPPPPPVTHIVLAATRIRAEQWCRDRGLPLPNRRTPTERTIVVTSADGARYLRGLTEPIELHYANGGGEIDPRAWDAVHHAVDIIRGGPR
jgi:hypothetical protein